MMNLVNDMGKDKSDHPTRAYMERLQSELIECMRPHQFWDEQMLAKVEGIENQIIRLKAFLGRRNDPKNDPKTILLVDPKAITVAQDNSSDRTRTCDPGLMKPSTVVVDFASGEAETHVIPTPAERSALKPSGTCCDQVGTNGDQKPQLGPQEPRTPAEKIRKIVTDAGAGYLLNEPWEVRDVTPLNEPWNGEGQAATTSEKRDGHMVLPLLDDQGRRLIHLVARRGAISEMFVRAAGILFSLSSTKVMPDGINCLVCYREVLSPEEESHLPENQVDTSHDGILA